MTTPSRYTTCNRQHLCDPYAHAFFLINEKMPRVDELLTVPSYIALILTGKYSWCNILVAKTFWGWKS